MSIIENEKIYILISYLIGSIPMGFIVARIYGKNILDIGWRKTSGSNVFRNVGKAQGVLTAFLDGLKAYLTVYFAQKLGFSTEIQVLSGVATVIGNNWSLFLGFAGGRGIGAYVGALIALNYKFLLFTLPQFLLLALIWQSPLTTLVYLLNSIIFSIYTNDFKVVGIFTLLCLIPLLLKRLSPFKELSFKNKDLIRNRLVFDNDLPQWDFKLKGLFDKLTKK